MFFSFLFPCILLRKQTSVQNFFCILSTVSKLSKLGETWQRNKERKDFSISLSHQQSLCTDTLIPGVRGSQLGRVQLLPDIWARARVLTMAHYPRHADFVLKYIYTRWEAKRGQMQGWPHLTSRHGGALSSQLRISHGSEVTWHVGGCVRWPG